MPLEADVDRLSRVPLFSVMGPGALRLLAFAAESYPFASGEFLFRRGEPADGGYVIVSGMIDLLTGDAPGGPERHVGPGTLLGEQALLAETLRPISARAAKATSTLKITRAIFARALREYPDTALVIRQMWARRLHERLAADEAGTASTITSLPKNLI